MESIPALAFLLLLVFVPESPRWLVARGRQERALEIFRRAGGEADARRELEEIEQTLKKEKATKRLMWSSGIRLALFLGVSLAVLQQFTGIDAIIYYGPRIMESAGFALHDALGSQVLIGAINMGFTLLAIWKIDQFGRRKLLISGTSGMLVSLLAIGFLFLAGRAEGMLLLVFIMVFIASFAFSLGPVVWVILSEIYPTSIRGRAMSIATMAVWIGTATIGQMIPLSLDRLGPAITFWIFALFCIPTIWIGWKMLPETKGKTLEEIERYWMERGAAGGSGAVR